MRCFLFALLTLSFTDIQPATTWAQIEMKQVYAPAYGEVHIPYFVLYHTVQYGETLNSLAARFLPHGADPALISHASSNPDVLQAGETISITAWPWEIARWEVGEALVWKSALIPGNMDDFNTILSDHETYWNIWNDAYNYHKTITH